MIQPLWKIVWEGSQNFKIKQPYDPAILLLGIFKENKTLIKKDTCTSMFLVALFIIAKVWKQLKCPLKNK